MVSRTERRTVAGPEGDLVCAINTPDGELGGTAVVCQPHPQHGGTMDNTATRDWARPQTLSVVVVPGGGHFFHGQLPLLKSLVVRHLSAPTG